MLNAWVYALAVERWSDLSVVIAPNQLEHIECSEESRGEASTGWDCLFSPMPNLCTFHDAEVMKRFTLYLALIFPNGTHTNENPEMLRCCKARKGRVCAWSARIYMLSVMVGLETKHERIQNKTHDKHEERLAQTSARCLKPKKQRKNHSN